MVEEIILPLVEYAYSQLPLTEQKVWEEKDNKDDFIEHLANYLVDTGLQSLTVVPKKSFQTSSISRLVERHFPKHLPKKKGKIQALLCKACNFTTSQLSKMGYPPEDCHVKQVFIGVKSANHHCA